jgi:hypothetical protein
MPLTAGERLGPYVIEGPLGAGGMGEVYRARDTRLNRLVAIKVLPAGIADDAESRERFHREARAISTLEHPNVCALHDVGEQDGRAYLVMQFLEGTTLATRLVRGPLPLDQALRIGRDICSALDAAHRHGIVHRDVKPGNVMLTPTGARLLDFGLAKQRAVIAPLAQGSGAISTSGALTAEGMIVGTLHYMAPEQIRGEPADARSDIYAFGTVMYEMLTGKPPFDAADPASLIGAILTRPPPPLVVEGVVPPRLERAIGVCLEKEPEDRWQSARDLTRELQWIADERSTPNASVVAAAAPVRSSRRAWLLGTLAAAVVAIGAYAAWGGSEAAALPELPVVIMMDSPHPMRVYDTLTLRAGGTNADDLTDLLSDLPLALRKETTSTTWHRETQVMQENPDLILVHRSCFYDQTLLRDSVLDMKHFAELYAPAADKLETLLGYVALGNDRTRFIVYSRGSWATPEAAREWVTTVERRFPQLAGRLTAYKVPLDRATFRHPETGAEIKQLALSTLRDMGRVK